jgi:hypothetical protein
MKTDSDPNIGPLVRFSSEFHHAATAGAAAF